jgi:uncharacterized lipoprotein NlpE involved in copper resistance
MKKNLIGIVFITALLTGCSQPQKVNSYEYYLAHIDEAKTISSACKTADHSDENVRHDCSNAAKALAYQLFKNGTRTPLPYGANSLNGS